MSHLTSIDIPVPSLVVLEDVSWGKLFPDLYPEHNGLAASRRNVSVLCCPFTPGIDIEDLAFAGAAAK